MDSLRFKLKNLTECSICYELISEPKLLPCRHTFCSDCISKLLGKHLELKENPRCPLCRREIMETNSLQTNVLLEQIIGPEIWKRDTFLILDSIKNMKRQVLEADMTMAKCLKRIHQEIDEAKQKLQLKLDSDYKSLLGMLNEIEVNQNNTSSFYSSTIDDLLSDFNHKTFPLHRDSTNPFLSSGLSFSPRIGVCNLTGENIIGDLRFSVSKNSDAEPSRSVQSLILLGVLVDNEPVKTKTNVGVAITKSYICSIKVLSRDIHLFDIPSLLLVKNIEVPNLRNPQDMCSLLGSDRIYVADSYDNVLHMIELESSVFHCWLLSLEPTNISSCMEGGPRVWVACRHSDELLEIDGDNGKQLRKIDLQSQIVCVSHALSLECPDLGSQVLVLCHGILMSDCRHQVLVVDDHKGKPIPDWCFGSIPAGGAANANHPSYLASVSDSKSNKTTSILVADQSNGRILQLHFPSMEFMAAFTSYNGKSFKNPQKILYDNDRHLLVVVENDTEWSVLVFWCNI